MPRLILQAKSESEHIWVLLDGEKLISLRDGDSEGLKAVTTWLVDVHGTRGRLHRNTQWGGAILLSGLYAGVA
ncbi:MAG: hypothetical protein V3S14_03445 [Anaerolineae bacterium]